MRVRRLIFPVILLLALAAVALLVRDYARRHPENVPWTALDLRQPIGGFTGRKPMARPVSSIVSRIAAIRAAASGRAEPAAVS